MNCSVLYNNFVITTTNSVQIKELKDWNIERK
ncbi:hypothetical protein T09_2114 [Trichinella sp. T9]|nr:hypothetical protein T09_2114 [Trichinella sp. T9]